MSFTAINVTDVAKDPSGVPIPYAVAVVWPRIGFANSGTKAAAVSAIGDSGGNFTLTGVSATDDGGTAPVDPNHASQTESYHLMIMDPLSGEHVFDLDFKLPSATSSPTTLAILQTFAV